MIRDAEPEACCADRAEHEALGILIVWAADARTFGIVDATLTPPLFVAAIGFCPWCGIGLDPQPRARRATLRLARQEPR